MGSTVCVRCGATLIPHSYCEFCHDVLRFICSSCSMYTDERTHAYCNNCMIQLDNDIRKLVQIPNLSQIVLDDRYNYVQNHLNEEIKYNSINLFTTYWNSIFDSFKLVNRYWRRIIDIGNSSQNISQK
jgi:predicted amidophosphoribosyltransferase